jgi:hypothetical protein
MNIADLRDKLHYNPDSGLFTRPNGKIAGSMTKRHIQITVFNKKYYAHRLAFLFMTGDWPKYEVDHINRIGTDNRWANLRDVDHSTNCFNRGAYSASGVKGIYWLKDRKRWQVKNNNKFVGTFRTIKEAKQALKENRNG